MITDAWMQFDWTLALPMTLLLVYFLFILQRYCWRIYKRFRLPSDAAVTGAFNIGGQLDDAPQQAPGQPMTAEQQEQYAREMAAIQQQYAHLPESVRAAMGIGAEGGMVPPGCGGSSGAGPSGAGPSYAPH